MIDTQSAPSQAKAGPSGRTAALVLVAALLVAMLALPVRNWFLQQARIAEAESRLAQVEGEIEALAQEEQRWADPQFVQREARLRLNYVMPGEAGVVVLQPGVPEAVASGAAEPRTWLEALWYSVDAAAGRGDSVPREAFSVRPTAPR